MRINILLLVWILCCGVGINNLRAQVPIPAAVNSMAVYKASVGVTDSIPDGLVNYNITSPVLISSMLTGIESDTLRDCSVYDAKNTGYLYVKFTNGNRKVYNLFINWTHFSGKGDRLNCYYITPPAQVLFKANAQ